MKIHIPLSTLETKRLILQPPSIKDFDAVHSWAGNPENVRYMAWGPNDEVQTRAFLSSAKAGYDFTVRSVPIREQLPNKKQQDRQPADRNV